MSLTLSKIKAAEKRLSQVAVNTPLVTNRYMNNRLNAKVYFKLENCQQV